MKIINSLRFAIFLAIIDIWSIDKRIMIKSNKQTAGEGAAYMSMQVVASLAASYVFWIILSKITTTGIIGTFSIIFSLAEIFANIAIMGIPDGIQRFLAKSFSDQNLYEAKVFLKACVLLLSIGILVSTIIILSARNLIHDVFRIDFTLIIMIVSLTISYSIYSLLYSLVIASLKIKVLTKIGVISSITKILLATILISIGGGIVGLTIGYALFGQVLSSILLAIVIINIFKISTAKKEGQQEEKTSNVTLRYASRNVLIAGAASWIPLLVPTIGKDLGALLLFASHGSSQTGLYFIAFTISAGITSITFSIFTVGLPALSAMRDGRKRFTWQIIRLSAIISVPISSSLIFYSNDIMQLIGQNYIDGSLSLQILLLPMLPTAIMTGIDTLIYSSGAYRLSLIIGLVVNIPRTILYFILVPIYGSAGAAVSYTIGSLAGFAISVVIAKRFGVRIFWKYLVSILIIPTGLAFALHYFHVNYIVGILLTIVISMLLFLKLRILTRSDVQHSIEILPTMISNPINKLLKKVDNKQDNLQ